MPRPRFAALLALLLLTGRPGSAAETAAGTSGPTPPVSFAPPGSLLSPTKPGQPAAATPGMSFPSVETLVGEMAVAPNAGEESFYEPELGLRGRIPPGWKLKGVIRWIENEVRLVFEIPAHALAQPTISYRKFATRKTIDDAQLADWFQGEALAKSRERQREGYSQYQMHTGTMHTVGERPALTWLADYMLLTPAPLTAAGPLLKREHWIELLTQIHTLDGALLLSLRAPEKDMAVLAAQFESLVQSVTLPGP